MSRDRFAWKIQISAEESRASTMTPRNMVTEMAPMMARVAAAFFAWGRRNAGTPFEIASTPVRAVDPEENAWRITNRDAPEATPISMVCWGRTAWGHPPNA